MKSADYVAKLSAGLAVGGVEDTIRALNERRVQRLLVCANLTSMTGWECQGCRALHGEMDSQPEQCSYCGSTQFQTVDLKGAVIVRAYRLGCAIETVSRCLELEQVGGIGAILLERGAE